MTDITSESSSGTLHVALIMDGNGRWAQALGRPRIAGHREGAKRVREVVRQSPLLGIGTLTLYAFSSDNWKRPESEVMGLMRLLKGYLKAEAPRLARAGVKLGVIGRRDRLSRDLVESIEEAECITRNCSKLHLRLAIDYSAQDALVAASRLMSSRPSPQEGERAQFREALDSVIHSSPAPDVDLLIRTGGEQRLSDFLLWEVAYAEILFDPTPWPAYTPERLASAVGEFARRERRFGALPLSPPLSLPSSASAPLSAKTLAIA